MKRCAKCMDVYGDEYQICPHCGYVEGTPQKEIYQLLVGTTLCNGRYTIGVVEGSGGFGTVYRAWDNVLNQMVAIKEYYPASIAGRVPGDSQVYVYAKNHADEYRKGLDRFLEEARYLAKFGDNSNIVHVYNFFEENKTAYSVMQFLPNGSLMRYIKEHGGILSEGETRRLITPILDALTEIHHEGIVHRDISPDNIMFSEGKITVLMDFGAARLSNVESKTIVLKPGYAPPEQYQSKGKQGPYTDVYAVGAMMYRMTTGIMPPESIDRMQNDTLTPPMELNPEISEKMNNIILRAMSIQPELRFQSTKEFKQALMEEKSVRNTQEELKRRKRIRRITQIVAILLLAAGCTLGGFLYYNKKSESVLKETSLTLWVSAKEEDQQDTYRLYTNVFQQFQEKYPQVEFRLEVIPEDNYAERIKEAFGGAAAPDVFESTLLNPNDFPDMQKLDVVRERLENANYYFVQETSFPTKLVVAVDCPVMYVNTYLTDQSDTATWTAEDDSESNRARFLNNDSYALTADTSLYHKVQGMLPGKYRLESVPGQTEVQNGLSFSIRGNSGKKEKKAAYVFLEFLLSEEMQNFLCVQNQEGVPVNREEYRLYLEVNPELEELGKQWISREISN